jgi:hypothetical protein
MVSLGILLGEAGHEVKTEGHVYYESASKFPDTGRLAVMSNSLQTMEMDHRFGATGRAATSR